MSLFKRYLTLLDINGVTLIHRTCTMLIAIFQTSRLFNCLSSNLFKTDIVFYSTLSTARQLTTCITLLILLTLSFSL